MSVVAATVVVVAGIISAGFPASFRGVLRLMVLLLAVVVWAVPRSPLVLLLMLSLQ